MTEGCWDVETSGADKTARLGKLLGSLVHQPLSIWLSGDLGTGKTCFTQGVAQGLGVPPEEPVTSPSYTLMNQYQGRLTLFHFDLYRLSHPEDLDDLGFAEYLEAGGVTVVEWADRFDDQNRGGLFVRLSRLDNERRRITFCPSGTEENRLVEELAKTWPKEPAS